MQQLQHLLLWNLIQQLQRLPSHLHVLVAKFIFQLGIVDTGRGEIIKENSDSAASFFARVCLDNYDFPVESIISTPNGSVIHRININALLGLVDEQESFFEIRDPVEKNYQEFLENALLMSKAIKVDLEKKQ
ncbi:selenoprotein N [Trichonephila clavipes]|nr:selenoprotein N [Trichonephila clavipes]